MKKITAATAITLMAFASTSAIANDPPGAPEGWRDMCLSCGWTYESPGWQTDESNDDKSSGDKNRNKNKNKNKGKKQSFVKTSYIADF